MERSSGTTGYLRQNGSVMWSLVTTVTWVASQPPISPEMLLIVAWQDGSPFKPRDQLVKRILISMHLRTPRKDLLIDRMEEMWKLQIWC